MEEVSLNEAEARFYSELFQFCDVEKTGKIAMLKAMELYRSANISNDVIMQITSVANIPATALHISRAQFYSCLKLIAAYQTQMPLREEIIAATLNLPLPKFSWKDLPSGIQINHNQTNGLNPIPPPPADRRNSLQRRGSDWTDNSATVSRRNSSQQQQVQQESSINSDVHSTDSEIEQNESSCGGDLGGSSCALNTSGLGATNRDIHRRRGGSPEAWSTNSDSPTPTNSVAERPWAKEAIWHGLLGDEHRQLLGTEEESSDRHSSDEDNETDLDTIYQITPEQREYYYKQFKAVQHDNNGLLSGQVARIFFEKSRIPVEELRHIWQLCDVTRDGALSLAEFTAAMHLVVLRRNNIPLPAVLPDCLHPNVLQQVSQKVPNEPPEADLLHLNDDDEEDATDHTLFNANTTIGGSSANNSRSANEKNVMNMSTISNSSQASTSSRQGINTSSLSPPPIPPPIKNRSKPNSPISENDPVNSQAMSKSMSIVTNSSDVNKSSKDRALWTTDVPPTQWTKFTESPTSNVSSPGPKPVNFDMQRTAQAVVSDPQILHPVALRVTPVGSNSSTVSSSNIPATSSTNITNNNNNNNETSSHQTDAYEANLLNRDNSPKQQTQSVINNVTHGTGVPSSSSQPPPAQPPQLQQQQQQQQVQTSSSSHRESLQNSDLRAIQRPQAKKLPSKNIGALPPPPQRESLSNSLTATSASSNNSSIIGANPPPPPPLSSSSTSTSNENDYINSSALSFVQSNKKEPPPLPPPRPHRHGRSSSLDLNKFKMNTPSGQQAEITTQASFDLQTSTGFADFSNFPADSTSNVINEMQMDEQQQHSLPPPIMKLAAGSGGGAGTVVGAGTGAQQQQQQQQSIPPQPLSMPPTRLTLQSNQRVSAFEVYRKPNTPRNSQSPPPLPPSSASASVSGAASASASGSTTASVSAQLQQQQSVQSLNCSNNLTSDIHLPQPTQPPPPAPFGALGATAITANTIIPSGSSSATVPSTITTTITNTNTLPNADLYEKRVNAISENLKHVSFKQEHGQMPEILKHLREQNTLLLRLCNDLSDELLTVQTRKEDLRLKLEILNADSLTSSSIQTSANTGTLSSSAGNTLAAPNLVRTGSSISAPVTANVTGGSGSSGGGYSNV